MPLLGGLLGGGILGGALRGLGGGRRGGGGSSSGPKAYPLPANREAPSAPEPEEQPRQEQASAQPEPPKQPPEQPTTQQVASDIAQPQAQQQAQQQSPIRGLLDEAPASKPVDTGGTTEEPKAPSIVNKTETMTPVARPGNEQFGQVPSLFKTDGVLNQLMDSGGNRQPVEFQEGLPSRTPNIEDRAFSFKGPSGVAGAIPARRYGMRS